MRSIKDVTESIYAINPMAKASYERHLAKKAAGQLYDPWADYAPPKQPQESRMDKRIRVAKEAGIPDMYQELDFYAFKYLLGSPQHAAKNLIEQYVYHHAESLKKGTNLILAGGTGTGKTALACIAGIEFAVKGYSVMFQRAGKLVNEIKVKKMSGDPESAEKLKKEAGEVGLLVLDDLALILGTDADKNIITEILMDRYEKRKPVIITSNVPCFTSTKESVSLDKLLGEMTTDRLLDVTRGSKQILFTWPSYRRGAA